MHSRQRPLAAGEQLFTQGRLQATAKMAAVAGDLLVGSSTSKEVATPGWPATTGTGTP